MVKARNIFDQIFSMENLYAAYEDAARGRRYHGDVLSYSFDTWTKLKKLRERIYSGEYTIDRYYIFYVFEPKKRMIMSISFEHRIVQWAIYRVLNPIFANGYIEDSYGCIPGRGALGAMQRLHRWVSYVSLKESDWHYLKLDVSKYFYRISHRVLKKVLRKKVQDARLPKMLDGIIDCDHTPFGLPPGKSPGEVPLEDRLYDVGMPIGNLLSQMFANLYLNELDQYCKRELGIKHYVRYMDDIIILSDDKAQLRKWREQIRAFLKERLELDLNEKTCIRPIGQGIEFVGYRVWPNRVQLRKSTTLRMKRSLRGVMDAYSRGDMSMERATDTLTCYLGMLGHTDSQRLEEKILEDFVLVRDAAAQEKERRRNEEEEYIIVSLLPLLQMEGVEYGIED